MNVNYVNMLNVSEKCVIFIIKQRKKHRQNIYNSHLISMIYDISGG